MKIHLTFPCIEKSGPGEIFKCLLLSLSLAFAPALHAADYPTVTPNYQLQFPRDHGSHPQFRTEWWYITGWIKKPDGADLGIQVTFFRVRPGLSESGTSQFAPRQLVFAHAALADAKTGRLLHDQRSARAGFGLAEAKEGRTEVWIDDWSLKQTGAGYRAKIASREFDYALDFKPTQPILLQGERGVSRKGPRAGEASYYYSQPHLAVSGTLSVKGEKLAVSGTAWLDHEWSSQYLAKETVGWDWVGLNFSDGGALMAFRMRDKEGRTYWAGGAYRDGSGRVRVFKPGEVSFTPLRRWRSPRTQAEYPVAMRVRAGDLDFALEPVMDDQELDSRASTGAIYWEGAVRVRGAGPAQGFGYLELTGYWRPLRL